MIIEESDEFCLGRLGKVEQGSRIKEELQDDSLVDGLGGEVEWRAFQVERKICVKLGKKYFIIQCLGN